MMNPFHLSISGSGRAGGLRRMNGVHRARGFAAGSGPAGRSARSGTRRGGIVTSAATAGLRGAAPAPPTVP
jgi:hypothetical protein